jgi:hypothetical protein
MKYEIHTAARCGKPIKKQNLEEREGYHRIREMGCEMA